uniref:Uncharacterized protein n=1 Tax=Strombidium inclinatum TaxID=197538 RepID=A0A7S3IP72_9SPIT|mmetsp:Transcript_31433/g.48050  ORF Transcript_31433/g.48050 Transcript_31433/m.48050 type:complete len:179 (+) Transcript_31433:726-1262(+)
MAALTKDADFWMNLNVCHLGTMMGCLPMMYGFYTNMQTIFSAGKHSFWHCVDGLLPCAIIVIYFFFSFKFTRAAWHMPALVVFAMGSFLTLMGSRVIIATVTKSKFSTFKDFHLATPILFGIAVMPLNKVLGLNEVAIFVFILVGSMVMYFYYILNVIDQICEALDINCLTIKHKKTK